MPDFCPPEDPIRLLPYLSYPACSILTAYCLALPSSLSPYPPSIFLSFHLLSLFAFTYPTIISDSLNFSFTQLCPLPHIPFAYPATSHEIYQPNKAVECPSLFLFPPVIAIDGTSFSLETTIDEGRRMLQVSWASRFSGAWAFWLHLGHQLGLLPQCLEPHLRG